MQNNLDTANLYLYPTHMKIKIYNGLVVKNSLGDKRTITGGRNELTGRFSDSWRIVSQRSPIPYQQGTKEQIEEYVNRCLKPIKKVSKKTEQLNRRLIEMENLMDGFAGRNWRDEYKGYNRLSLSTKLEVLQTAIAEYR